MSGHDLFWMAAIMVSAFVLSSERNPTEQSAAAVVVIMVSTLALSVVLHGPPPRR